MDEKDRKRLEQDLAVLERKLERVKQTIEDYSFLEKQPQTIDSLEIIKKRRTLALTDKSRLEQLIQNIKWLMEE